MNNAQAGGHMVVILGLLFKGFVILGVLAIIFTLWVLIHKATRKAVGNQGSKDYGSIKAKSSGLLAGLRDWRQKHLQKKLDKLQKKLNG